MSKKSLSTIIQKRIQIQGLLKAGHGIKEIAKILKVSKNTVKKWKNRKIIQNKKGQGRKKKLSSSDKTAIKKYLYRNFDGSLRKTASILNSAKRNKNAKKTVHFSTIRNYIKTTTWGEKAYKSAVRTLLSEKNIKDRAQFGKIMENEGYLTPGRRGEEKRSHILFTDETWLEINTKSQRKNKYYRTEKRSEVPPTSVPKFSAKVMIAGGICARGVTRLHFVPQGQNVNAKYYREEILPNYFEALDDMKLFPMRNKRVLMQDGAKPHVEKQNLKTIDDKGIEIIGRSNWPGNSPDLNPIENLWSILKDSVYKEPLPKNLQELKSRFQETWDSYPASALFRLTQSFKRRIENMMEVEGGHPSS